MMLFYFFPSFFISFIDSSSRLDKWQMVRDKILKRMQKYAGMLSGLQAVIQQQTVGLATRGKILAMFGKGLKLLDQGAIFLNY